MSSFKALMVHRDEDKTIRHEMTELQHGDLPADGEVLVAVKYTLKIQVDSHQKKRIWSS